ncbi:hypothetical protein [Crocosphaera chwakensis]|nr:hypothetical protein [Crocosphaera chwakensis]
MTETINQPSVNMHFTGKSLSKEHIELAGIDLPHISDCLLKEIRSEIRAKLKRASITNEEDFQEIVTATVAEIMPLWVYED